MNILIYSLIVLATVSTTVSAGKFIDKRPGLTPTTTKPLEPWIRTVSSDEVELVTPAVIDGITFSASPRIHVKTPTPWVSLKKDGVAKTITPKVKGAETKNGWPDYDDWFARETTMIHDLSNKKVKGEKNNNNNNKEVKVHKEIKFIPQDESELRLNPLIRCTPDRYFDRKGEKKNSAPFCTPQQNTGILFDQVHWVSWYTRFFKDNEKVRLHLAYVEDTFQKLQKREILAELGSNTDYAFWSSDWIENSGFYPLSIEYEWLMGKYNQQAVLAIQPESVYNEDFDLLHNGTIIQLREGPTVRGKQKKEPVTIELKKSNDGITMAMLALPTCLLAFLCVYMFVVYYTRTLRKLNLPKPESNFRRRMNKTSRKSSRRGYGYERLNSYEMT